MKKINNYVPVGLYNEDEGPRLEAWNFVPDNADPSVYYDVAKETIYVKEGENPFDLIESIVPKEEMGKTWIIIEEPVLELARKIPEIYHFPDTISNPEVFNFNAYHFERSKVIHLNKINGFDNWKIICAWIGKKDKNFIIPIGENPEKIVRVAMD